MILTYCSFRKNETLKKIYIHVRAVDKLVIFNPQHRPPLLLKQDTALGIGHTPRFKVYPLFLNFVRSV